MQICNSSTVSKSFLLYLYGRGRVYPCHVYGYRFVNPLATSHKREYILSLQIIRKLEGLGLIESHGKWRNLEFSVVITQRGEEFLESIYKTSSLMRARKV